MRTAITISVFAALLLASCKQKDDPADLVRIIISPEQGPVLVGIRLMDAIGWEDGVLTDPTRMVQAIEIGLRSHDTSTRHRAGSALAWVAAEYAWDLEFLPPFATPPDWVKRPFYSHLLLQMALLPGTGSSRERIYALQNLVFVFANLDRPTILEHIVVRLAIESAINDSNSSVVQAAKTERLAFDQLAAEPVSNVPRDRSLRHEDY